MEITDLLISGIYSIENLQNGKKYIGSSENIVRRINTHKYKLNKNSHENGHLQNSWNKYGEINFEFNIVEKCPISELEERENYYIDKFETLDREHGFNMKDGSQRNFREEYRKKLRQPKTEEEKINLSNKLKGRKNSELQKEMARRPRTEEWKNNISLGHIFKKIGNPSSKYIGVRILRRKGYPDVWATNITYNRERIYLGIFEEEIDAAKRVDEEYKKLYNSDVGLNFP